MSKHEETEAENAADPQGRLEELVRLREATGCTDTSCRTCAKSSEDWDGDPGAPIYCGMTCDDRDALDLETYLEGQGIDIDAERDCWIPKFWLTKFADLIDGTNESLALAIEKYRNAVEA